MSSCISKMICLIGILGLSFSCSSDSRKNELSVSGESGIISISDYNVQFGTSSTEPIETGLKLIIRELQSYPMAGNKLKGTVVYTFRCEANGMIRWIGVGESDLLVDNQNDLKNELITHLMKKQVRFPELGEVTMLEAKIKFE